MIAFSVRQAPTWSKIRKIKYRKDYVIPQQTKTRNYVTVEKEIDFSSYVMSMKSRTQINGNYSIVINGDLSSCLN
jgi:hypothetical protein